MGEPRRTTMKRTITGISSGGFLEDLSSVQVSFSTSVGVPITCHFTPQVLEKIIMSLSEMAQHLRNQQAAKDGHLQIDAAMAEDASASSPVGGGNVILGIRTPNNVLYNFALLPEIATRLLTELQQAEESAKRQAAQTRQ
jgi:hypothetical protein